MTWASPKRCGNEEDYHRAPARSTVGAVGGWVFVLLFIENESRSQANMAMQLGVGSRLESAEVNAATSRQTRRVYIFTNVPTDSIQVPAIQQ